MRKDLQQVAKDALGNREGSVVAIDPRTGGILAFWSFPSYDPNLISSNDLDAAETAYNSLLKADGQPLRAHQYQERYFPGSTFKMVTGSIGVNTGVVTVDSPSYPVATSYMPPARRSRSATSAASRAAARSSRSSRCRATRPSPRWAPRPSAPTR